MLSAVISHENSRSGRTPGFNRHGWEKRSDNMEEKGLTRFIFTLTKAIPFGKNIFRGFPFKNFREFEKSGRGES